MEIEFNEEDKFIILASDGIWEFICNQEVVDVVKDFYLKNDIYFFINSFLIIINNIIINFIYLLLLLY